MEIAKGVFENIVAHALTIGIAALILAFYPLLLTRLSNIFYKVRVGGHWKTILTKLDQDEDHEAANLYQFFSAVWGKTRKKDTGRVYRVRGHILGDKLCMVYRLAKGAGFDCGAILLSVKADGTMEGYEVGIDLDTDNTYTCVYRWSRE